MIPVRNYVKGEKISEPGIYAGVPIEVYHSDCCVGPSISSSGLRTIFKESPEDYFLTSVYNDTVDADGVPMREEREVTKAMILGKAAHHLILGESYFAKSFALRPAMLAGEPWQGNRKACREWIAAAEAQGKAVVSGEDVLKIKRMAAALNREPLIQNGLMRGYIERSFFYRDKATGIWVKGRPDIQPTDDDDFVDYKTAASVDYDSLEKAIDDFGYYIQGGVIDLCWRSITGRPVKTFNLVFQKSSSPYSINMVELKASDLKAGAEDAMIALRIFAQCLKTGEWFGPAGRTGDLRPLGRKPWAIKNGEFRYSVLKQELEQWDASSTKPGNVTGA